MYRVALSVVFALGLSACSVSRPHESSKVSLEKLVHSPEFLRNSNASVDMPGQPAALAMLPPEAGRITRVSQKDTADGFRQEIIYGQPVPGLGESGIDLRVRTTTSTALEEPLLLTKPTEAGIRSELAAEFPGMTMQVVDGPRNNAYGPYGLAVGRWANGARCMYAWQWINKLRLNNFAEDGQPASVRVRLCHKNATLDQLASHVDRMQIDVGRYERPRAAAGGNKTTPFFGSGKMVNVVRNSRHLGRSGPVRRVNRQPKSLTPAIAMTTLPHVSEIVDGGQLDPSLPAAAYRGPSTLNSTAAVAQK